MDRPAETKDKNLPRVLVVDDEKAIQRFLKNALSSEEFSVHLAGGGKEALTAAIAIRPDLIILDLGLPDMDGIEVLRRLREWTQVPVIILSVRDREGDKVAALDSGADDFLTKPFGIGELLARMRVAFRRSRQQTPEPIYKVDGLEVDLEHRRVLVQEKRCSLRQRSTTFYGFWSPMPAKCSPTIKSSDKSGGLPTWNNPTCSGST